MKEEMAEVCNQASDTVAFSILSDIDWLMGLMGCSTCAQDFQDAIEKASGWASTAKLGEVGLHHNCDRMVEWT